MSLFPFECGVKVGCGSSVGVGVVLGVLVGSRVFVGVGVSVSVGVGVSVGISSVSVGVAVLVGSGVWVAVSVLVDVGSQRAMTTSDKASNSLGLNEKAATNQKTRPTTELASINLLRIVLLSCRCLDYLQSD